MRQKQWVQSASLISEPDYAFSAVRVILRKKTRHDWAFAPLEPRNKQKRWIGRIVIRSTESCSVKLKTSQRSVLQIIGHVPNPKQRRFHLQSHCPCHSPDLLCFNRSRNHQTWSTSTLSLLTPRIMRPRVSAMEFLCGCIRIQIWRILVQFELNRTGPGLSVRWRITGEDWDQSTVSCPFQFQSVFLKGSKSSRMQTSLLSSTTVCYVAGVCCSIQDTR